MNRPTAHSRYAHRGAWNDTAEVTQKTAEADLFKVM